MWSTMGFDIDLVIHVSANINIFWQFWLCMFYFLFSYRISTLYEPCQNLATQSIIVVLWDSILVWKYTGEWPSMPYAGLCVFTW
jgi:hypothetical protein